MDLLEFGIGAVIGGLSLSASWGLFWLAVGLMGFSRCTCGWRVLLDSIAGGLGRLLLGWAIFWVRGGGPLGVSFVGWVRVLPLALIALGWRSAPDGRRAGTHMIEGARHLMDELLGKHHECGGCGHDHAPRGSGESG